MKGSLAGVRARVERLAADIGCATADAPGCPTCKEDEQMPTIQYNWIESGESDEPRGEPEARTCGTCGRVYVKPLIVHEFRWQSS